jgi:DNA-binding GntR family transcriptional regulator
MNDSLVENDVGLSRVEKVYRTIRNNILSNQYPPGHQVLEPELAKQLGVSRTPVREALIRLEAEKLIELIPRRGMRVLPLVPTDYLQLSQAITALEGMALELLVNKKPGKDVLRPMDDALNEMDIALRTDDLVSWSEADEKFHRILSSVCGNSKLLGMLEMLRAQTCRARLILLKLRPSLENSNKAQRELYEAIVQGDAEQAMEIYHQHRRSVVKTSMELLERYSLPHL